MGYAAYVGAGHAFFLPATREEWTVKAGRQDADIPDRARQIISLARSLGESEITSYGVGAAWLEYFIKREAPDMKLTIGDHASQSMDRLKVLFPECDRFVTLDMTKDGCPPMSGLHVVHRVNTEFADTEMRRVFDRFTKIGATHILLVASEILTLKSAFDRTKWELKQLLRGRKLTFCGWLRSRETFLKLWQPHYELVQERQIGNLAAFQLRLKS